MVRKAPAMTRTCRCVDVTFCYHKGRLSSGRRLDVAALPHHLTLESYKMEWRYILGEMAWWKWLRKGRIVRASGKKLWSRSSSFKKVFSMTSETARIQDNAFPSPCLGHHRSCLQLWGPWKEYGTWLRSFLPGSELRTSGKTKCQETRKEQGAKQRNFQVEKEWLREIWSSPRRATTWAITIDFRWS